MQSTQNSIHGYWSSDRAFFLAATGSAVGLGNIWKFPYITGENGGGAFVIVYMACIIVIGVPVMMAEIMLGRSGGKSPIHAMKDHVKNSDGHNIWESVGWMGAIAGAIILSFYSVIAGWALSYTFLSAKGGLANINGDGAGQLFSQLLSSPGSLLIWHTVFMTMTMTVIGYGLKRGLEQAIRIMAPWLVVLLTLLAIYSVLYASYADSLLYLFSFDFSKLTTESVLVAMGHAFFTLSIGLGAIMTYGAYLPKSASIPKLTISIALADTLIALLSGFIIFSIVFSNGLEPSSGPGLIFQTLPVAFGNMPFGRLFGTAFFLLIVLAAWSSAISAVEPINAWLVEKYGITRLKSSLISGIPVWIFGVGTLLSFNIWSEYKIWGKTFFGVVDFLASNILLPLGGVLIALFTGWIMQKSISRAELKIGNRMFIGWMFSLRYVAPILIIAIFINIVGIF
ncbi:MAG: sodium-dependent transporter [Magnetococcales bacterium]|nr:sodium-dependent transporter [Magnetococcales bacterium]